MSLIKGKVGSGFGEDRADDTMVRGDDERDRRAVLTVQLSRGGKKMGSLKMKLRLKKKVYSGSGGMAPLDDISAGVP